MGSSTFLLTVIMAGAAVALSSRVVLPLTTPATLEDGVVFITWWACALLSIWLVGSVLMWRVALRAPSRRLTTFTSRVAMPGTRKLAESTLALSLILGAGACSIGPTTEAPTLSYVGAAPEQPTSTSSTVPSTVSRATSSATSRNDVSPPGESPPASNVDDTRDTTGNRPPNQEYPKDRLEDSPDTAAPLPNYEVRAGDNLWSIAENTLLVRLEHKPTSSEVGIYWRQLILASRDSIASGNPNLIYPGEILALPEPELSS